MKNEKTKQLLKTLFVCSLILITNDLLAGTNNTSNKIAEAYAWLKPVVHGICGILTVGAAVRAVYKIYFEQRSAPAEIVMFIVGLIFWALWGVFANDILSIGGTSYQF